MLTESEIANVRYVLAIFVGRPRAVSVKINEQVVEVVYKMLEGAQKCTKRIDLLPRPARISTDIDIYLDPNRNDSHAY